MVRLIKADFKKINFLASHRIFLFATFLLSIMLGLIFLFTLGVTEERELTELLPLEVVGVLLLGIDVATIMLIIFVANFIAKEFSHGLICTSLAITPQRKKFYLSKIVFIIILSFVISGVLTMIFLGIGQFILSVYHMDTLSLFDYALLSKLTGTMLLAPFYSLLSTIGAFIFRTAAGGTSFALGVMFIPALIKLFPEKWSSLILWILPEKSLRVLSETSSFSFNQPVSSALLILFAWVFILYFIGLERFKKADF